MAIARTETPVDNLSKSFCKSSKRKINRPIFLAVAVRHLRRWTTGSDFGPGGGTGEEIVPWSSARLSEYENGPVAAAGGCRTRNT